jgi:hypothetical protein
MVFRRCGLIRVNGSEIGVSFAAEPNGKKKRSAAPMA